jgi:hypothetical protein
MILVLHRDEPVACVNCGRRVARRSRRQIYCSPRCKERSRERVRKGFMGVDTGAPTNPSKNTNLANGLQPQESRSRLINNAIHTEFFGGGKWERVMSPDGVAVDVTRLWGQNASGSLDQRHRSR